MAFFLEIHPSPTSKSTLLQKIEPVLELRISVTMIGLVGTAEVGQRIITVKDPGEDLKYKG
jgi:hypothetical protein